jgi:hypothetical protein
MLFVLGGPAYAQGLNFEEIVIEGEIQKPEVTIVISRENLNKSYDLKLEESFLQKIVDALRFPPF